MMPASFRASATTAVAFPRRCAILAHHSWSTRVLSVFHRSTAHAAATSRESAKDGSGLTFIADFSVADDTTPDNYPRAGVFWPAGYLRTGDGSVYRFVNGRVEWLRDRHGNAMTFAYDGYRPPDGTFIAAYRRLTKVTDSLGRTVNITYGVQDSQYGVYDRIDYGSDENPRVIRVAGTTLANVLRATPGYNPSVGIFYPLSGGGTPNVTLVSAVWLPDGERHFQFFYNEYTELARLELPTGAVVEYDYWSGSPPGQYQSTFYGTLTYHANGLINSTYSPEKKPYGTIDRRLRQRRLYPNGGSTPKLKTVYSRITFIEDGRGYVTVDQLDATDGDRLLSRQNHYYYVGSIGSGEGEVRDALFPLEWKEYRTDDLSTDGNDTILKQVDITWEECLVNSPPDGTPWSPYVKEVVTRVLQTSTGQYRVDKVGFGYDRYNNRTDVYEYDYGTNQFGPLLRHTYTKYLTVNAVNAVDYSSPLPTEVGVYLRSLPERTSVYDGGGKERSRTTYEYDNYTLDPGNGNRHAALVAYSDIAGLCLKLDQTFNCVTASNASYETRGNTTGTTSYLLDKDGNVTGSVTTNQQYDVVGNVLKSIDARRKPDGSGYETTFDFLDNFGSPDGDAQNSTPPAKLGGLCSYAFPTKVTNALGQITYTQYDYHTGLAVNSEDANGTVTAAHYDDDFDRVTQVERAVNVTALHSQTTYTYDDDLRMVTTSSDQNTFNDNVLKTDSRYDGLGRVTETRRYEPDDNYIATLTQYDALGRISAASNPYRPTAGETPVWTTTAYDDLGRVWKLTTPDSGKVYTLYDAERILVADQAGKQRISQTNALGKLTHIWEVVGTPPSGTTAESVTFPVPSDLGLQPVSKGYVTTYTYDVLGNLRKVEQGGQTGQHRYFAYDSLSRLIRVKSPEQDSRGALALPVDDLSPLSDNNNGWSQAFEYYEDGSVQKRVDARGVVTNYTYDALGRLSKRSYSGEAGIFYAGGCRQTRTTGSDTPHTARSPG